MRFVLFVKMKQLWISTKWSNQKNNEISCRRKICQYFDNISVNKALKNNVIPLWLNTYYMKIPHFYSMDEMCAIICDFWHLWGFNLWSNVKDVSMACHSHRGAYSVHWHKNEYCHKNWTYWVFVFIIYWTYMLLQECSFLWMGQTISKLFK